MQFDIAPESPVENNGPIKKAVNVTEAQLRANEGTILAHLTESWQRQIRQNEKEFSVGVDGLEVYERKFLSCLQDVETVQKQSN